MSANHELIGKNIFKYRQIRKMTQQNLSNIVDVARSTLSEIECGRAKASINLLLRIAKALNVGISDLLYGNLSSHSINEPAEKQNDFTNFQAKINVSTLSQKEKIYELQNQYIIKIKKQIC